jgi:hypothetical protein
MMDLHGIDWNVVGNAVVAVASAVATIAVAYFRYKTEVLKNAREEHDPSSRPSDGEEE